jgi:hypothetical protein
LKREPINMTIRLAAPLALLALSCAGSTVAAAPDAHAGHTAQPTAEAEAEAKPAKSRRVCRRETATGSVMPKRVCRTAEQVEADERNAERLREQQNRMGNQAR